MSAPVIITKNSREEIRVSVNEYQGHQLVSLRVWFEADDGDMRPSKKGLAFRVELLPQVSAALKSIEAQQEDA
ncbi:transcriptional coactivator p15/PC4 family protein [Pseudooceanicola sp. MF1-13]|uniref:transcriptional coactivator p15/PC4 family protein n=1 Tax=Pseudooceanicola sp. MF1-13 TaxID=3379095 RepID=UPI0038927284